MTNTKLESLLIKQNQIEAQIKDLQAIEKSKKRKKDTRAKIILGAALVSEAKKDQANALKLINYLTNKISNKKDKEFLVQWAIEQNLTNH